MINTSTQSGVAITARTQGSATATLREPMAARDAVGLDGRMEAHAVVVVDTEGIITSWNDGAAVLFGHDARSAIGRPVDMIVPEHLRDAHWAGFRRAMAAPKIKDMAADLPVLCADGEVREFPGRLLALSDGLGSAIGAIAIYRADGSTGVRPFSASSET
ncbi:MAG: PAS domain S-box protein [Ornithinimicrobium sp.]